MVVADVATHRTDKLPRAAVDSLETATAGDTIALPADQAKHLTGSRRLRTGARVEVFDAAGRHATAELVEVDGGWTLRLAETPQPPAITTAGRLTVYAAVPKGPRADWMVEKLAELGVGGFVPLLTSRSVVKPGNGKVARWRRLAAEAAKQSHAAMPLDVADPRDLAAAIADVREPAVVLTTERPGAPLVTLRPLALFIGPEGGWTMEELDRFLSAGVSPATLGPSVLRVETAAICGAAVVVAALSE